MSTHPNMDDQIGLREKYLSMITEYGKKAVSERPSLTELYKSMPFFPPKMGEIIEKTKLEFENKRKTEDEIENKNGVNNNAEFKDKDS